MKRPGYIFHFVRRIRRAAAALLAAAVCLCASAQTWTLTLELDDGSEQTFAVDPSLRLTFVGGELILEGLETQSFRLGIEHVGALRYGEDIQVKVRETGAERPLLSRQGDELVVSGLGGSVSVEVLSLDGSLLQRRMASGEVRIDLRTLPPAPVIINIGGISFKYIGVR